MTPLAAVVAAASLAVSPPHLLAAPKCAIFPASNPWNQAVDSLPVASNSAQIIRSIGTGTGLHADFGSGLWEGSPIGIPFNVVSASQAKQRIKRFEYAGESDKGPYPIPARPKVEGGSDKHLLIVDKDRCTLYELGGTARSSGGWTAWAGAIWRLRSNKVRPETWTSADAAGLPILPGSRAGTTSRPAGSTTHSASRSSARGAPTSIRRGITRAPSPIRIFRRWACVSG